MKRNTMFLFFTLLLLSFAIIMTGCGSDDESGGGGGSTGFDWNCTVAPSVNIDGSFSAQDTSCNPGTCSECYLDSFSATITHDGNSNTFSMYVPSANETYTGRICGNAVAISGTKPADSDCELGTDINSVGTVTDANHATTSNTWTCRWNGGSCSGTSQTSITRN
jgi:hypothetical protein